jgi:hypothetical protein
MEADDLIYFGDHFIIDRYFSGRLGNAENYTALPPWSDTAMVVQVGVGKFMVVGLNGNRHTDEVFGCPYPLDNSSPYGFFERKFIEAMLDSRITIERRLMVDSCYESAAKKWRPEICPTCSGDGVARDGGYPGNGKCGRCEGSGRLM